MQGTNLTKGDYVLYVQVLEDDIDQDIVGYAVEAHFTLLPRRAEEKRNRRRKMHARKILRWVRDLHGGAKQWRWLGTVDDGDSEL